MLSLCLIGFLFPGVLPDSMLSVVLVPTIKSKTGRISSKDNYRPIALASTLSKVLEIEILTRLEGYMITNANQFGFLSINMALICVSMH